MNRHQEKSCDEDCIPGSELKNYLWAFASESKLLFQDVSYGPVHDEIFRSYIYDFWKMGGHIPTLLNSLMDIEYYLELCRDFSKLDDPDKLVPERTNASYYKCSQDELRGFEANIHAEIPEELIQVYINRSNPENRVSSQYISSVFFNEFRDLLQEIEATKGMQSKIHYTAKSEYFYVITNGHYYKVGITINLEKRLKQLQTGSPELLTVVLFKETKRNRELETKIKEKYSKKFILGEWVDFSNEDLSEVAKFCGVKDFQYKKPSQHLEKMKRIFMEAKEREQERFSIGDIIKQ